MTDADIVRYLAEEVVATTDKRDQLEANVDRDMEQWAEAVLVEAERIWDEDKEEEEETETKTRELLVNLCRFTANDRNDDNIAEVIDVVGLTPSSVDDLGGSIDVLFHVQGTYEDAEDLRRQVAELEWINGVAIYDPETGDGD